MIKVTKPQSHKVISLILLFSVCCFLSSILTAYAVDIEPMRLEYSLKAGKTYSGSFTINNSSNFAVDVLADTGEYRYIFSEGMIPPDGKIGKLPSCRKWLQFEKTEFSLYPGQSIEVPFTIKVPGDAAQEHLCAVIFDEKITPDKTTDEQKTGNVQVRVIPRFSVPVYISIEDKGRISAEIKEISVMPEPQTKGVTLNITLKNTGTSHIRPYGTLVVLNQNGDVIKNLPIGKSLPLFPGYQVTIPVICPKLPIGNYSAVATVEISKDAIIQKKASFAFKGIEW